MKNELQTIQTQGLSLAGVETKEEAIRLLGLIHWAKNDILFGLGDWMVFCEQKFGKDFVNEQLEFASFSFEEASKAYEVAKVLPREKRHRGLTFDHHAVAVRSAQPELALDWALEEGLTPGELAHSVRVKVLLKKDEIKAQRDIASFPSPAFVAQRFTQWLQRVPRESWTPTDKAQILNDLRPIVEFVRELEQSA
jgi:hypothetical protein